MLHTLGRSWWALGAALLAVASACEEPQSPHSLVAATLMSGATLAVNVNTTFAFPDVSSASSIPPGGFVVWVDDSVSQAVAPNGAATFGGLAAGDHEVALYSIPFNCVVGTVSKGPNNPVGASMMAGTGAAASFSLGCGSWGGLFVSTNTTGVDLGAGYTVSVDGGAPQAIGANDNVTLTQLYATNHTVTLAGVATNCALNGLASQTVSVSAGQMAAVTFAASCVPLGSGSGTLMVKTNTAGSNVGTGYTVTVDGTVSRAIGINDSATFAVPAGANPVALAGFATNCAVSATNPGTVSVAAGGTDTVTFPVTCAVPGASVTGTGQLGMGAPTLHSGVQTFDFVVRADLTGRFTIVAYDDVHPDGTPATVYADASKDPATGITAYRTSSPACSNPSHGVEFDGIGRDAPDLVPITVVVCDDGPQGSGKDFLSFFIPKPGGVGAGRSGIVTSGDIVKH